MITAQELCQNKLLSHLPEDDRSRLAKEMKLIRMDRGKLLHEPGDRLREVFFPISATVSILYELDDDVSAEVAVVGNEGVVGIALFLSSEATLGRATIDGEGLVLSLGKDALTREFNRKGSLRQVVLCYIRALIMEIAQSLLCLRHHSQEQQFCRWLLRRFDRQTSDNQDLLMTQEMIAYMLGMRRSAVSEIEISLRKAGLINYSRGRISLLDRRGLLMRSCKCYEIIKEQFDRLIINTTYS